MKKDVRFLCAAAVAVGIWTGLFFSCVSPAAVSRETAALDAVPVSSMIVARTDDPAALARRLSSSPCAEVFDSLEIGRSLDEGLRMLARLTGRTECSQAVTVAASKVGAKGLSLLYVIDVKKELSDVSAPDTLTRVDRYEKTDIVTIETPSGSFCYYVRNGSLVLSDSRLYLEQSILQQASGGVSLDSDRSFVKSYPVLFGGKALSVAFRLPDASDYGEKILGISPGILGDLAPWAVVELRTDSTTLRAEGLFCSGDSAVAFSSVLAGQKAKDITLDAYFPSDTYGYQYLGIVDWQTYFSDYIRYLKASSQFHVYNTAARTYDRLPSGEPWRFFLPWAGTGMAIVRTASDPHGSILIGVKDPEAAVRALETLADSSQVRPDSYKGVLIVPLKYKNLFYDLVTHAAPRDASVYAAVSGQAAVFAPSIAALRKILDDIRSGTTLSAVQPYMRQKAQLATATQMLVLVRGDLWSAETVGSVREKRKKGIARTAVENYVWSNEKRLKNLRYNFFQVSATGGTAFLNVRLAWDESVPHQVVKEWSFAMDAPAASAPVAFPNHNNGRYDVLVQDAEGTLYLISDRGSLFWKKKLGGPITSPIVVCDLYDNRRYQMAFWTGEKFHVIDRLGRYVTAADKVARAKKIEPDKASAVVASTNEISYRRSSGGGQQKVKTPQSPLVSAVYVPSVDALVYRLADGRIYALRPSGESIPGFPVTAEKDFTAQDFGRDGRLGVAALSPEGVVSFYRLARQTKRN